MSKKSYIIQFILALSVLPIMFFLSAFLVNLL